MYAKSAGLIIALSLSFVTAVTDASALIIISNFTGGTPITPLVGTGTLQGVFTAAAAQWEKAIRDPYTLTLNYGWSNIGSMGDHTLNAQGGSPNRETAGTIRFDSLLGVNSWTYFLDPTPSLSEEFFDYRDYSADLGGGVINTGRNYYASTLPNASFDVFSVALHEIGHALGDSLANWSWVEEAVADGDIDITAPRDHAGTTVQMARNNYGVNTNFADMGENIRPVMVGTHANGRNLLSELDILAIAQVGHFSYLDYDPYDGIEPPPPPEEPAPVPEPSTWALMTAGLLLTFTRTQRRRR